MGGERTLSLSFVCPVPLLQSGQVFSPGDGRPLVLETLSEHCRGVEGYCGTLPAASELG